MLKTNRTLKSLDLRGNGILDQVRRKRVVATDEFGRAAIRATIFNVRPAIVNILGAELGNVAIACGLPKEQFDQHSSNEDILAYARTMEL
jgi:hypothetical protein